MIYRINETIIYNPDDGTVNVVDDISQTVVAEISLAPTANRLLNILISHQGSVLQREELLEQVWDNYGLKSSNNSLNQYVSMLRRNFADLGLEEMSIVTVPRVGFMFSQDLQVVTESTEPASPPAPDVIQTPQPVHLPPPPALPRTSRKKPRRIALLSLLILMTTANLAWAIYGHYHANQPDYEPRYSIGQLGGCPVYSFYRVSGNTHETLLAQVAHQMQQAGLKCAPGREIYFRAADTLTAEQSTVPFVSVCYPLADNRYAKCRSSFSN